MCHSSWLYKKHDISCANKLCHTNSYSKLYFRFSPFFCEPDLSLLSHPFYAAFSPQLTTINTSALFCVSIIPQIHKLPYLGFYSTFLIWMSLASIFMCCKRLWAGSFCLHFGSSALFCVSTYPKYPNRHISASIHLFDPISSPFLICTILLSILMCCKWLWAGSFWLNFGPSALFPLWMVPQIPWLPYLGLYLSVWPHLFTIPHLYDPFQCFYVL